MQNYFIKYNLKIKLSNGDIIEQTNNDSIVASSGKKAIEKLKTRIKKAYLKMLLSIVILKVETIGYY
jgi:predicted transcriptional regulator